MLLGFLNYNPENMYTKKKLTPIPEMDNISDSCSTQRGGEHRPTQATFASDDQFLTYGSNKMTFRSYTRTSINGATFRVSMASGALDQ